MVDIISAELNDAEAIISLQRLSYQSEARLYNDWSLPPLLQTAESLRLEFENSVFLKAVVDNMIVGSVRARMEAGVARIGRLIVHPDFQRQGIGSNLLRRIESQLSCADGFELFTGSKSLSNIRFYEGHGYSVSGGKALSKTIAVTFLSKPNLGDY